MADDKDPAVSVCFSVTIDKGKSLGIFNSCEGLGIEIVMEQREEGGNNGMVWQLPTRMKYSNVKLSRPISADSAKLTSWFAGMINGVKPATMEISAITLENQVLAKWELFGVIPVRALSMRSLLSTAAENGMRCMVMLGNFFGPPEIALFPNGGFRRFIVAQVIAV